LPLHAIRVSREQSLLFRFSRPLIVPTSSGLHVGVMRRHLRALMAKPRHDLALGSIGLGQCVARIPWGLLGI
jgi:hypothetical protein